MDSKDFEAVGEEAAPLELRIESLALGGDGVARWAEPSGDGRALVLFIPNTAPGDLVRAELTEVKKNYGRAKLIEVIEPGPDRRVAPCPAFGSCGGCDLQHLQYPAQLETKRMFVKDSLQRLGGIAWQGEIAIHAGPEFETRTRARFAIHGKSGFVGFRRANAHAVEDLERCPALAPPLEAALRALRAYVRSLSPAERLELPKEVYAACDAEGFAFEPALGKLQGRLLEPRVAGMSFQVGAGEFFQGHASLLPRLIEEVAKDLAGGEAWDLYAGVGLFARALAPRFHRVIAVESNPRAVTLGRQSLMAAGETRVRLERDSVREWLERHEGDQVDAVVLDPPRSGAKEALPGLLAARPRHIRYVSCDPTTLARDLRILLADGYQLDRVALFDIFPQTWHIETLAVLSRS